MLSWLKEFKKYSTHEFFWNQSWQLLFSSLESDVSYRMLAAPTIIRVLKGFMDTYTTQRYMRCETYKIIWWHFITLLDPWPLTLQEQSWSGTGWRSHPPTMTSTIEQTTSTCARKSRSTAESSRSATATNSRRTSSRRWASDSNRGSKYRTINTSKAGKRSV